MEIPNFQIKIIKGHDTSSYFWIMPMSEDGETEYRPEEISIEEGDVECFLSEFLFKYFDENLEQNKNRGKDVGIGFEWWLEYNFYTYNTMSDMLKDIKKVTSLLQTDYDNEYLKPFKDKYSVFYITDKNSNDYKLASKVIYEEEKYQILSQLIKKNISVVIDFYNRFIACMENMMKNACEYNLISFMGP